MEDELAKELRGVFLEELADLIEDLEDACLRYEKSGSSPSSINEMFRYFHNIKGSSKTVGFMDLSQMTHSAENILGKLRANEINPSDRITENLLKTIDLMRQYYEDLRDNGDASTGALLEHKADLDAIVGGAPEGSGSAQGDQVTAEFTAFDDQPLEAAEESITELPARTSSTTTAMVAEGIGGIEGSSDNPEAHADQTADATAAPQAQTAAAVDKKIESAEKATAAKDNKPRKAPVAEENIKLPISRIDNLLDLFGEQVILQSSLDHVLESDLEENRQFIRKTVTSLRKLTQDLQHTMVSMRMVSINPLFNRMERTIRDVSKMVDKEIEFVKVGETAELDKNIADSLVDPLNHMIRNAVDHGIESPEDREKAGKSRKGTIRLTARRNGGAFEIIIEDNGKGLDRDVLLKKAIKNRLITGDGSDLKDSQVFDLIFHSGFSTRDQATEISGRGVGMDVVRQQLKALKGTCQISSVKGKGTRFHIRLPLSLAMFHGTVVRVGEDRYVVPNSDFYEAISLDEELNGEPKRPVAAQSDVRNFRGRVLKTIDLRQLLATRPARQDRPEDLQELALITRFDNTEYAFLVNDIISQEQIVLKRLGPEFRQVRCSSGGTILGDGKVALVLDLNDFIKRTMSTDSLAG